MVEDVITCEDERVDYTLDVMIGCTHAEDACHDWIQMRGGDVALRLAANCGFFGESGPVEVLRGCFRRGPTSVDACGRCARVIWDWVHPRLGFSPSRRIPTGGRLGGR